MKKRLSIIFILGFSSGLPLALITNTLQAWFADSGRSFLETGLLSLVGLPYIFCFILAPLVDRYPLFSIGKRRSWIALMQIILILGFNLMAWFTPLSSPMTLAWLALAMAFVSALQDIAINAHRTEYLPLKEHGLGASIAVTGYRMGLLVSGGLALIIAQSLGWAFAYRFMGFMMLFGLLAVYFSPETSAKIHEKISFYDSFIEPVRELISRPRSVFLLLFVFFYKLGEAFTTTTSGIMMPFLIQYLGFSLDTIAYVNKIIGIAAIVAGGWFAGLILLRWSLYRALMVFGLIQGLTNLLFIALAMMHHR
jgi:PAT family beta-lactamase induction signal transducer AmpG